ncbi:START domain-containing protein [Psidium guajava]|nr:START domain-containing protein [Psidium guajava]
MNSIFSSFDFLSAKLFGQKVKAHLPPALGTIAGGDASLLQRSKKAPMISRTESKSGDVTEQEKQEESSPRFAPELDGIHCFETIVSH